MQGRIILITGSTDGIGKQTAIDLSNMGAFVIIHGRNEKKVQNALKEIKEVTESDQLETVYGDLGSFSQIRDISDQLHKKIDHLDVLVNNAGVNFWEKKVSVDSFELTFAVNYLAPYMLTLLVLDLLKKGLSSRIVNVTSDIIAKSIDFENLENYPYTFKPNDSGNSAYGISKACLNMFTFDLAEKLKDTGITANCVHPGGINTKMLRKTIEMMNWDKSIAKPITEGSNNVVYAIFSPRLENLTGKFLYKTQIYRSTDITYNTEARNKLKKLTEEFTSIKIEDFL